MIDQRPEPEDAAALLVWSRLGAEGVQGADAFDFVHRNIWDVVASVIVLGEDVK